MWKFFCLVSLIAHGVSNAQTGHYFLSHYAPDDERLDPVSFDMVQTSTGVLYLATRSGVVSFDGRTWEKVTDGASVYALEIAENGVVYWAGENGYGRLVSNGSGSMDIELLSSDQTKDVFQIATVEQVTYFMTDDSIYCFNPSRKNPQAIARPPDAQSFTALFSLFGIVYASTEGSGIFRLHNDELIPAAGFKNESLDVIFATRHDDQYLVGTADNRLFLCREDLVLHEIVLKEKDLLNASVVVAARWISSQMVIVGTLRNGLVCIHPESGRIEEKIDYATGLPDNEVLTLMSDENENVWVSHEYGLTRISPFLPFRSFHHYEGLQGNILCATTVKNQVYAGTSLGLFKLIREDKYDEIIYPESQIGPDEIPEEPKRKRGLFRFLRRNKNGKTSPATTAKISGESIKAGKTRRVFLSSEYRFKRVEGINAKVSSVQFVDGKLIASGLSGVHEIRDDGIETILEEPVRQLFASKNSLLASTTDDDLLILKRKPAGWSIQRISLRDQISNMRVQENGNFWLFGSIAAYHLKETDGEAEILNRFSYPQSGFSKAVGLILEDRLLVANGSGFFYIDPSSQSVELVDSLGIPKFVFSHPNGIWYHDGHLWKSFGADDFRDILPLLGLCRDIKFIGSPDERGNVWIVNGNNELYNFASSRLPVVGTRYPLYLKMATQGDRILSPSRIHAEQEGGELVLEFAQPGYTDGAATEFRYKVKGLSSRWSDWSPGYIRISFPFLPHGNYSLTVQSRDVFGNVQELEGIDFRITLPYWKTPWFYAMELTIFVLLIWLSFKLSYRYRFVSRVLSLLTIILLIELIQTIAGYSFSSDSSPLLDFLIQVVVAFVILPVEGFLRNLWFKSTGANSRLYQVISELDKREKSRK